MTDYPQHPITYSRAKLFADGSAPRLGVAFRPGIKVDGQDQVLQINGIGPGTIAIYTSDIETLVELLYEARRVIREEEEGED